jgi:hypothetical protein
VAVAVDVAAVVFQAVAQVAVEQVVTQTQMELLVE